MFLDVIEGRYFEDGLDWITSTCGPVFPSNRPTSNRMNPAPHRRNAVKRASPTGFGGKDGPLHGLTRVGRLGWWRRGDRTPNPRLANAVRHADWSVLRWWACTTAGLLAWSACGRHVLGDRTGDIDPLVLSTVDVGTNVRQRSRAARGVLAATRRRAVSSVGRMLCHSSRGSDESWTAGTCAPAVQPVRGRP